MTPGQDAAAPAWLALQAQFERYEHGALGLKLAAVALCTLSLVTASFGGALPHGLTAALLAVLWVQEGIYRTYQARLGQHLLRVEQEGADAAFTLHSAWQKNRPGTLGLLAEYAVSALRPTVAFPYPLLGLISLLAG